MKCKSASLAALSLALLLWAGLSQPQAAAAPPMAQAAIAYYDSFENAAAPDWDAYLAAQPRYYRFKEKGKTGILDAAGRQVLPPVYKEVWGVDRGVFIVKNGDYGLAAAGGRALTELKYDELRYDLAENAFWGAKGNTGYLLDHQGRILASHKLDKKKEQSSDPNRKQAYPKGAYYPLQGGGKVLLKKGKFTVLAPSGEKEKSYSGLRLEKGRQGGFMLAKEEEFTFFDDAMQKLSEVEALSCRQLPNGIYEIERKVSGLSLPGMAKSVLSFGLDQMGGLADRWFNPGKRHNKRSTYKRGYVSPEGKEYVPTKFDYLGNFYRGRALVADGSRFGYANAKGGYDVPVLYEDVSCFSLYEPDTLLVETGGRIAYYQLGKGVLAKGFQEGRPFVNGLAAAKVGGQGWGYIDKEGGCQIPFLYSEATPFYGAAALVRFQDRYQLIDRQGQLLQELPEVEEATSLRGGSAAVKIKGKWGLLGEDGSLLVPAAYAKLELFCEPQTARGLW